MQPTKIDLAVPKGWHELSDKQLRFVFRLISLDFSATHIKTLCLLKWSRLDVIGRKENHVFFFKKSGKLFELATLQVVSLLSELDYLATVPLFPVRIGKLNRRKALPADFSGVPFEVFIICDNLYQGYLQTRDDEILDELGCTLYGKALRFKPWQRISIFYWFAALKGWLARRYPDFFQPIAAGTEPQGAAASPVEEAMNAQIRALTKGDVTKEAVVLATETHRALTELNAQAREYNEFKRKYGK